MRGLIVAQASTRTLAAIFEGLTEWIHRCTLAKQFERAIVSGTVAQGPFSRLYNELGQQRLLVFLLIVGYSEQKSPRIPAVLQAHSSGRAQGMLRELAAT